MKGDDVSPARRLEILLFCVRPGNTAGTIGDHIDGFVRYSRHRVHVLQNLAALYGSFGGRISRLPRGLDLPAYDVFVIHYTNYLLSDLHFDSAARERIANFRGLKVLFLQDEYRQIDAIAAAIRQLGIDVLFTCVPETEIEKVYPAASLPGLSRISNLTGYVPPDLLLRKAKPLAGRPVDVGYRARQVPFWLGALGAEKWQIAPAFLRATAGSGLRCDISFREEDRIYGKRWTRFLESCRSVLGTESGASVFDFTGELQRSTERYLADHPHATFEEIHERFLKDHEGRIRLNQISPRCFEAAALRTAMVLYEGEYSGILEPERHYLPLRKDFSNIDEIVNKIRDTAGLQDMADRTYREIAGSGKYSYQAFVEHFDEAMEQEVRERGFVSIDGVRQRPRPNRSTDASGSGGSAVRIYVRRAISLSRYGLELFLLRAFRGMIRAAHWVYVHTVPESARDRLRPYVRRIIFKGTV